MAAVATQPAQRSPQRSGYTSFPRTTPQRTYSHDSAHSHQPQPSPARWFSCNAPNNVSPDPETDHPPSPPAAVEHKCMPGNGGQDDPRYHQQQRSLSCYPVQQQQQRQQPNYPTTIRVPSQDNGAPFDEDNSLNEPPWGLSRMSLDDTFGFESNTNTKSDDLFESLYAGTLDDAGTKTSSVDLNSYTSIDYDAVAKTKQKAHIQQNRNNLTRHVEENNRPMQQGREDLNRSRSRQQQQQPGRDSIFRSHSAQPPQISHRSAPTSYEKKISENMQMLSPTLAMDRRRSRPQVQAHEPVVSPNSSMFASSAGPSILRTGTGTSIHRNNTGSSTSRSRHRSTSRNHRSRSRGTSRGTSRSRRSRSRSTSIAPSKSSRKGGDDYHSNLFRGAALIREQLLRSMASADQVMEEAEREFMEEMIERGSGVGAKQQQQQLHLQQGMSLAATQKGEVDWADNGDIDFDYSFDHDEAGNVPSPSRESCVRFGASQDSGSSALETESRRLDNLMRVFAATSSMSSSSNAGGHEMRRSLSDKENEVRRSMDARPTEVNPTSTRVISPTSSLGLSSPTSQLMSPMHNTRVHNQYASQYFQEQDVPKPIVFKPSLESFPEPTVSKPSMEPVHQPLVIKPSVDPISTKTSTDAPRQSHQTNPAGDAADEALAHARKAGPLWRSLVGNHVRFPTKWDAILPPTSPTIYGFRHKWSKWYYVARHRVKGDRRLNSREFGVRSRRSGGRILMRMIIREIHSQQACREIAVGCFHPNSKGIRKGDPLPEAEDVREVWMAVRWVMDVDANEPTPDLRAEGNDYEGVIDNYLLQKRNTLDYVMMGSALGHRKAVNNENVRAIFGDQPPMTTVDLHEDEVAEIIKANGTKKLASLPALMLLKLFLFAK